MFCGRKMEEGWDLNEVVRGYTNTGKAKTAVDSTPSFSFSEFINETPLYDQFGTPFGLPALFGENNISNPFDELGNFYKPFYPGPPPPPPPPLQHVLPASPPHTAAAATVAGTVGILNRSLLQQQVQQQALLLQQQEQQQLPLQQGQEQVEQQQQQQRRFLAQQLQHDDHLHHPQRPIQYRCRKRKSEQKRTTYQVTAENILSTDHWAWRKYGQKPIKGSPYPRNYYRCSSSKGCTARKQVEKSPNQPNLYLVTYTGDHCHPRPTHRNSLAGSSRTKFYVANKPSYENLETKSEAAAASTSSVPKIATASPPPISPSSELSLSLLDRVDPNYNSHSNGNDNDNKGDANVAATGRLENFENELEVFVNGANEEEEMSDGNSSSRSHEYNGVLIPNLMVDEDMLAGMKELGMAEGGNGVGSAPWLGGSGGGYVGNSAPPWNPIGCSASAGGAA